MVNSLIICEILIFITISFTTVSINAFNFHFLKKQREICETKSCVLAAADILKNMDRSVDPCDDFYEFACGNFDKIPRTPDDGPYINSFSIAQKRVVEETYNIIKQPIDSSDRILSRIIKTYFSNCMNTTLIENNSENELKKKLKELGGWPVLEGDLWNEKNFHWAKTPVEAMHKGSPYKIFLDIGITINEKNCNQKVIRFGTPSFNIDISYLKDGFEQPIVKAYYDFMVDIATMLGGERKKSESELKDALLFEITLANVSWSMQKLPLKLDNLIKLSDLNQNSTINWTSYINLFLSNNDKLKDNDAVFVPQVEYLRNLIVLLKSTPPRTLANFAFWRIASFHIHFMNERFTNRISQFRTSINRTTDKTPRWKKCTEEALLSFPESASLLYIQNYFPKYAKKNTQAILINVQASLRRIIEQETWMDSASTAATLRKLKNMYMNVAYPEELVQNELEKIFINLELHNTSYLESVSNYLKFNNGVYFKNFGKPIDRKDWLSFTNLVDANAVYSYSLNTLYLPAAILQGAFFSVDRPRYLNYGGIGGIIGHEMLHALDSVGIRYDMHGYPVDNWWTNKTIDKYIERKKCLIKQYENYSILESKINGTMTQNENIADNGGIKAAYYAYSKWEKKWEVEPSLPGLHHTPRQLFWISFANVWCSSSTPNYLKYSIRNDNHTPNKYRVIGSLSNLPEFARDFNCRSGSRMNPVQKCSVW